ncbi:MAG TPA: four helix bundle protein [Verrucomicrobiae bacterium]|nr:four helix bundle protein [Verrucomicrobiae bacterium]
MGEIRSYRDLVVWQQAIELAVAVYKHCSAWPKDELYGLISQARRAAVSIAANIAEGYGRDNRGSYVQFLRIAQGSLKELETHMLLAERLELSSERDTASVLERAEAVGKMLRALIRKLEAN